MNIPENARKFLDYAKADMDKHNINYRLIDSAKVSYLEEESTSSMVSGYYDDKKDEFACATGKPFLNWFEIFIHEYCHFLQYRILGSEIVKQINDEEEERFDEWLGGEELGEVERTLIGKKMVEVEAECEATVVEVIKTFGLEDLINVDEYIQRANAYLHFYAVLCKTGKWYNNPPYEVPEVCAVCGNEFKDDYWELPEGFENLVKKHCYKGETNAD